MIRHGLTVILPFLLFHSCTMDPGMREVTVDGKVRILLPENLVQSPSPNPDAVLHYEDTMHSLYFLVLEESRDSMKAYEVEHDLSSYFTECSALLSSRLSSSSVFGLHALKIHGRNAFGGYVKGMSGKEAVMYSLAAVQSEKNFYQVVAAYPQADSLRWKPVLDQAILSFREL